MDLTLVDSSVLLKCSNSFEEISSDLSDSSPKTPNSDTMSEKLLSSYEELVKKYEECEEKLKTTSLKLQESEEENEKIKRESRELETAKRETETKNNVLNMVNGALDESYVEISNLKAMLNDFQRSLTTEITIESYVEPCSGDEFQVRYEEVIEKYLQCEKELLTTTLKLQKSKKENKKLKSEAKKTKSDMCSGTEYTSLVREYEDEHDAKKRELNGKINELKKESEMRGELSIGKVIRGLCLCLLHVIRSQFFSYIHRDSRDEFEIRYKELIEKHLQCEEKLKTTTLKVQKSEKENKKLKSEARDKRIKEYLGELDYVFDYYVAEIRELEGQKYILKKESEMWEISKGRSTSYTQVIRGLYLTLDHVVRNQILQFFSSSNYKLD